MGHEDSRTTADIYEQDLDDSDFAVGLLERVLGCDLAEAPPRVRKAPSSGAKPVRDAKGPLRRALRHSWKSEGLSGLQGLQGQEVTRDSWAIGAAEGTRTLDLLHGKQCQTDASRNGLACK
jgi:hypothetical protein